MNLNSVSPKRKPAPNQFDLPLIERINWPTINVWCTAKLAPCGPLTLFSIHSATTAEEKKKKNAWDRAAARAPLRKMSGYVCRGANPTRWWGHHKAICSVQCRTPNFSSKGNMKRFPSMISCT